MIRTKGEAGTGDIIEAIRHQRMVCATIRTLRNFSEERLKKLSVNYAESYVISAKELTQQKVIQTSLIFDKFTYKDIKDGLFKILQEVKKLQRLPVVNFAAGGIATPADAAIMMQLGSDGVFVGSGIFKSNNPEKRAKAIVKAVANFDKPKIIAQVSKKLGEAMMGIEIESIPKEQLFQGRGW
jgi:pyridoxal 5'-phosphate synthase pdxS subunit